jgi:hypothetical protein
VSTTAMPPAVFIRPSAVAAHRRDTASPPPSALLSHRRASVPPVRPLAASNLQRLFQFVATAGAAGLPATRLHHPRVFPLCRRCAAAIFSGRLPPGRRRQSPVRRQPVTAAG